MADYNTLIQNGNFVPSTVRNAQVEKYENFRYGLLLNYNMNQWQGWTGIVPPAATFDIQDVPVRQWAINAKKRGADYALLTILNEFGFLLYESEVTVPAMASVPMNNGSGLMSPQKPLPYQVSGSADKDIVTKFVTEFRERGIEPLPYINIALNYNLWSDAHVVNITNAQRREEFIAYYCLILQEMVRKFGFKYLWFDAGPTNSAMMQRWYNAVKSVDPECMIICNNGGDMNLSARFPYDIQSCEEYAVYTGNESYKTNMRTHNGVSYYIGQEICGTPYGVRSEWYDWSNVEYPFPYQPLLQRSPLPQFQSIVEQAREYNRPFLAGVLIDRAGNFLDDNVDYLNSIDFKVQNVQGGRSEIGICRQNASFETLGINAGNTSIIYKITPPFGSFIPGRPFNGISSFAQDEGYLIEAKSKIDAQVPLLTSINFRH